MRREPVIERQVNPIGSVVTLTAQLNFPAELRSNDGKVTVVGTETKKITLESRTNKSVVKSTVSECLMNERIVGPMLDSLPIQITEISDSSFDSLRSHSKNKQQNRIDLDLKNDKKILVEVDDNISAAQKKVEETDDNIEMEKRGKNGKTRRKISKGEKNKNKTEVEIKSVDEYPILSSKSSSVEMILSSAKTDLPFCDSTLQGTGDIEMQLREASSERDFDDVFSELEDCKGRKRSLDTTVDIRTTVLSDDLSSGHINRSTIEEVKENHKTNSRHRKKSRMNDQDSWSNKNIDDDKKFDGKIEDKKEIKSANENSSFSDSLVKLDEKGKGKKKKSKKSTNMGESVCEESHINIENNFEIKKADDSDIETLMLEVSQETLCPESCQGSLELEATGSKTEYCIALDEKSTLVEEDMIDKQPSLIARESEQVELNCTEEKNSNTDDELRGFESDLLVKDCSWSSEKYTEKDVRDDKDSDKEVDKVKNDETTDKDSSDDCQPVVVKSDFKVNQKRGKNRKMMRKNRDTDLKVAETENNQEENCVKEESSKSELMSPKEGKRKDDLILKDVTKKIFSKADSEDELFDVKHRHMETKSATESFPDLKVQVDVVKRRIRKRETSENEPEIKDQNFPDLDIPKRSWSSIVSSNVEDSNGNISKPEEPIAPVRSWSSIAAGPVKSKPQDTDVIKTNSLEDRDSVYESCNDSVGEEVEPTLDSLGSCYFELETKDDIVDSLNVSGYVKEVLSDSKNGSSVEDKSNTDSGEKDDLIVGIQTSVKKSKKQKKKKR